MSSPDNLGKYVLVGGEKESFPPGEMARTLAVIPKLKKGYFDKPAWTAYLNRVGLFLGGTIAVVAGIVIGVVLLADN